MLSQAYVVEVVRPGEDVRGVPVVAGMDLSEAEWAGPISEPLAADIDASVSKDNAGDQPHTKQQPNSFGNAERMKRARAGSGWTQQELAKLAGCQEWTITKLETGRTVRVDDPTLRRLSSLLNLPLTVIEGCATP